MSKEGRVWNVLLRAATCFCTKRGGGSSLASRKAAGAALGWEVEAGAEVVAVSEGHGVEGLTLSVKMG